LNLAMFTMKLVFPFLPLLPPAVGSTSRYELVPDRSRTSTSFIKRADAQFTVVATSETSTQLEIDYDYVVASASGSDIQVKEVSVSSFDPANLDRLRAGEVFTTSDATIQHAGYEKVKLAGLVYSTDVLKVTNVKSPMSGLTDIVATVYMSPSVPLLGILRVDAAAKYNGVRLKAGLDWEHWAELD